MAKNKFGQKKRKRVSRKGRTSYNHLKTKNLVYSGSYEPNSDSQGGKEEEDVLSKTYRLRARAFFDAFHNRFPEAKVRGWNFEANQPADGYTWNSAYDAAKNLSYGSLDDLNSQDPVLPADSPLTLYGLPPGYGIGKNWNVRGKSISGAKSVEGAALDALGVTRGKRSIMESILVGNNDDTGYTLDVDKYGKDIQGEINSNFKDMLKRNGYYDLSKVKVDGERLFDDDGDIDTDLFYKLVSRVYTGKAPKRVQNVANRIMNMKDKDTDEYTKQQQNKVGLEFSKGFQGAVHKNWVKRKLGSK